MKRSVISALLVIFLLAGLAMTAFAQAPYFVDEAGLVSDGDAALLETMLESMNQKLGFEIVIATVSTLNGADPEDYAEQYYDYFGYGVGENHDGVILLINIGERDWVITSTGYGQTAINESAREHLSDLILPYLKDGDYATAFRTFASEAGQMVANAKSGHVYKPPFGFGRRMGFSLIFGAVAALISVSTMKGQLKSVSMKRSAADYSVPGSLNVQQASDRFLYRTVTRTVRQTSSGGSRSGGGGGGGHSSSSGKF